MGSYELHAWRDAAAIASLLDDLTGAARARAIYERISLEDVKKYESDMSEALASFIRRSESQRPSVVRKLPDETTRVCFLTLAILGCLRAKTAMEIRDQYREALAQGRGNRETTASLYRFVDEIAALFDYGWPWEAFDALGIDDSVDDDDGDGDKQDARAHAPLKPTAPAPDPEPEPVTTTNVALSIGTTQLVAADASGTVAWKLYAVEPGKPSILFWIARTPPQPKQLATVLAKVAEMPWGDLPTLLLLPESQRELVEGINAAAGKRVAGFLRRGVSNRAFMKWPDETLLLLKRELELVGEAMPDATEFMTTIASNRLGFTSGSPAEDWLRVRSRMQHWTRLLLAARGRWKGEVRGPDKAALLVSPHQERDLAKGKRQLASLHDKELTPLGAALVDIATAMFDWTAGIAPVKLASTRAAQAYMNFLFSNNTGHSGIRLYLDVAGIFGAESQEMDLLELGLLQMLSAPFEVGGSGSWFNIWWIVWEVDAAQAPLTGEWLPSEQAIDRAIGNVMPAEVGLHLSESFHPLITTRVGNEQTALTGQACCSGPAGQVAAWLSGRSRTFHPYSNPGPGDGCKRWISLVAASGSTASSVGQARQQWPTIAEAIERRIWETEAKGKRTKPPSSLKISKEQHSFFDLEAKHWEKVALMAGRNWEQPAVG